MPYPSPEMFVTAYYNKNGTTIGLHSSQASAWLWITERMLRDIDEVGDGRDQLLESLRDGFFGTACELWNELTSQVFEITTVREYPEQSDGTAEYHAVEASLKHHCPEWKHHAIPDFIWAAYRLNGYEAAWAALRQYVAEQKRLHLVRVEGETNG